MTSRAGRRRRHKRHKERTKNERAIRLLAQWVYLCFRSNHPQLSMLECLMALDAAREAAKDDDDNLPLQR